MSYVCPHCSADYSSSTALHSRKEKHIVEYDVRLSRDGVPDTNFDNELSDDYDESIDDDFLHFKCGACGNTFDQFDETTGEDVENAESDEEEEPLTELELFKNRLRNADDDVSHLSLLRELTERPDVTLPFELRSSVHTALKNIAVISTADLKKLCFTIASHL